MAINENPGLYKGRRDAWTITCKCIAGIAELSPAKENTVGPSGFHWKPQDSRIWLFLRAPVLQCIYLSDNWEDVNDVSLFCTSLMYFVCPEAENFGSRQRFLSYSLLGCCVLARAHLLRKRSLI